MRMRTSHCSNLVVSSLCCSWCVMGSSFKCAGMVGVVQYLASRDIVRLLPSRAGGEKEGTRLATSQVIREKRARLRSEAGAQKSSAAVLVMSL